MTAVIIGRDATQVGETVDDLSTRGVRAAGFVGDPATERDALVEMIAELFPSRPGDPEPA